MEIRNMTIAPATASASALIYGSTSQRLTSAGPTDSSQLPFQAVLDQQSTLQASLPSGATTTLLQSSLTSPATAPVLPPRQGNFVSFEMSAIGGKVTSLNVAGDDNDSLQVGDQWQLSIGGGPPNTELKQLLSNTVYPPPFQTVGKTDANGNLTLTITATADQVGSRPYLPYYMQFPNTTGVSYDPTAPPGYHNALVALVTYDVNPAGTASPLTVPLQPAATETVSLPSAAASAVTAAAVEPVEVAQPLDRVSEVASTAA